MKISDELLNKINNSLLMALNGQMPEQIDEEAQSDDVNLKILINNLNKFFDEYNESCTFIKNITIGQLDFKTSRSNFLIKSYLKTLQMMLNHLTWKTKSIAEGDFTQRINFLGDFSNSYNYMVEMLDENIKKVNAQSQQIKQYQEQKLNVIIENMQGGVMIFDEYNVINFCNYYIENIFGLKSNNIIGKKIDNLIPEINTENNHLDFLINSNQAKFEIQLTNNNLDTLFIDVNINKILINEKKSYIAVIYDITDIKKMQKIKSEFVSTVSHELRTPLTAINGSLSLMKSGIFGEMSKEVMDLVNIADNNGHRLLELINDILDIEKIESNKLNFKLEDHDLISVINESVELNLPYSREFGVKLIFENTLEKLNIFIDRSRIIQVLTNLISNAVKFSHQNEIVYIKVEFIKDYVRVSVIDKGIGVSAENKDKLFQKFTQLDSSDTRKRGGTGLGLSISKAIIDKHNGNIGFDSILNEGSTFYFEIPYKD